MANTFSGKEYVKSLSQSPGIYLMYDKDEKHLYVGKAANLKKRVASYFSGKPMTAKLQVMVNKITTMNVIVTGTEAEALLLESNLIKQFQPRYNIQLRDDKSYPYIYLDTRHAFPRLGFYRGTRKIKGKLYGPYPSAKSVRETLALLQKIFPVRQCRDSFYSNRSRPCLQYQIKRCPAPCVDLINEDAYDENVKLVQLFLEGKSDELLTVFSSKIKALSKELNFEEAAIYRDKLLALQRIYQTQNIEGTKIDIDLCAIAAEQYNYCVAVTFVRSGRLVGTRYYPVKNKLELSENDLLESFVAQYYSSHPLPDEVIVNKKLTKRLLLENALSSLSKFNRNLAIKDSVRADRAKWLQLTAENALNYLKQKDKAHTRYQDMFKTLKSELMLESMPERIECFDISHSHGESTIGSCVVFDNSGALKKDYRRFNIANITPGDDYAAMQQTLTRRYSRILNEQGTLPDMILIDGGMGQLNKACEVMSELAINSIQLIGVAKGEGRKPGLEKLIVAGSNTKTYHLKKTSPALHLIQQIRDEAHRFAITGHRQKRSKNRFQSQLEKIPGIGDKRRKALLTYFGGIQGIKRAGIEDLQNVEGISKQLAESVYKHFH